MFSSVLKTQTERIVEEYDQNAPIDSSSSGGMSTDGTGSTNTGSSGGGRRVGEARHATQVSIAEFYGDCDDFDEQPRLVRLHTNLYTESTNVTEPPTVPNASEVSAGE